MKVDTVLSSLYVANVTVGESEMIALGSDDGLRVKWWRDMVYRGSGRMSVNGETIEIAKLEPRTELSVLLQPTTLNGYVVVVEFAKLHGLEYGT